MKIIHIYLLKLEGRVNACLGDAKKGKIIKVFFLFFFPFFSSFFLLFSFFFLSFFLICFLFLYLF